MDFKECIKSRRAIRNYTDEPVTEKEISSIVELAAYAPSWKNTQTAGYIAVMDKELKEKVADNCMMGFLGNVRNVKTAPVLVVVTTENGRSGYNNDGSFFTSKGTHWQSFDAGVASQTFCLAAHGLGMATVIMGIYDEEKVREVLNIPENYSISALISVGHTDNIPNLPKKKSVDELLQIK